MGLNDIAHIIDGDAKKQVYAETWGHLFPDGDEYKGKLKLCTGVYGENCILSEQIDIDGSPWWYSSLQDFVSDFLMDKEEGRIYEVDILAKVVHHPTFWEEWEIGDDEDVDITVPYKVESEIVVETVGYKIIL